MTTVACVWVKANVPYSVEYVTRLAAMVHRWMDRPYRFVCLTDRPLQVPAGIETIAIASPRPLPGWWAKIRLHDPRIGLTGRVLYLDLDSLIVAPLAAFLDFPTPFALVPHAGSFNGSHGRAVVKRFNSSVMAWDAGATTQIFDSWTPTVGAHLHGDQDHIGQQMPEAATFPAAWCPRISQILDGPVPTTAKVVLAKTPKNEEAAKRWPWVDAIWRVA